MLIRTQLIRIFLKGYSKGQNKHKNRCIKISMNLIS